MRLAELTNRRVAVWGTGREGAAAVDAIARVQPAELVAIEDRPTAFARPAQWTPQIAALAPLYTGADALAALRWAEVIVRSPVIGQTHPWIIEARSRGTLITGGTSLWLAEHAARTIAITGSKGKTTTTLLVHHLLGALDRPNVLGGNIGVAALSLPDADLYVLELSMYQCADLDDSPWIAAVTSLYPEHLDWSGDEQRYYADKLNLVRHAPGRVVVNGTDLRVTSELAKLGVELPLLAVAGGDSFHVTDGPDGQSWIWFANTPLFDRAALTLVGRHNESNLCIALGVLAAAGVDCIAQRDQLRDALGTFQPPQHRLEPIEDPSGITFVDDSISTIPQSAIHAIEAYGDRDLTILLGGEDRGVDYTPLRDFLAQRGVRATVIGLPDSGPKILGLLAGIDVLTLIEAENLVAAVSIARRVTPAGGVVLLSPAAPSYGHFDNFEHRSRVFREAIEQTAPATNPATNISSI